MSTCCCDSFSGSCQYRALHLDGNSSARETGPDTSFPWSERHLRCVWADPAFRPSPLYTADGRQVIVDSPGRWNLEAGPDFLEASLRTAPDEALFRGDIEIHIRPADWCRHGHFKDRRYNHVIAHVTYYDGTVAAPALPGSVLQIALREPLRQNPAFSFDSLDLPAYPFATLAPAPPCGVLFRSWSPAQQANLLESAGEERLRLKTTRLMQAMAGENPNQTLYEEILGALGYKQNRSPFQKLARAVPLDRLRRHSEGDPLKAYALLAGVSGLLPVRTHPSWDDETRSFVRALWDYWWKHQDVWQSTCLHREDWVLSNVRPVNNPLRRLMAAAELFIGNPAPMDAILSCDGKVPSLRDLAKILQTAGNEGYWAWRSSLSSPRQAVQSALIGPGRSATLLSNVCIPWMAASTRWIANRTVLQGLPAEDENRHIRHTAYALFGHDHNPDLYHSGLRQQGLLQIFHDFCLNSRNGCRECAFPDAITRTRIDL